VIWPEVVLAMTRAERFDEALGHAGCLEFGFEASSALVGLAEPFADSNRVAEITDVLFRIEQRDDRSHALSGMGSARA